MPKLVRHTVMLLLLMVAGATQGAVTALDTTVPFVGSLATSIPFTIESSGNYWLTLRDHGETLTSVPRTAYATANVNFGSAVPLAEVIITESGGALAKANFQAGAGSYSVSLFSVAGGGGPAGSAALNPGQVGVQVSAVPLPPAAVLFAGSLIALGALGRQKRFDSN